MINVRQNQHGRTRQVAARIERARRHNPALARQHYEEAVALLRQAGDPLLLAHAVRHLGDVYREAGELALAEPCYMEALSLYRANPNPPPSHLANAIRAMAVLQDQIGAGAQAAPLWEEARDLYTAIGIEAGVAECNSRLDGPRTPIGN